ncbi:MAG: ABC transporter permease [Bacteroidota bacterium]
MKALKHPPKLALRFLRFYSGDRYAEEIEGDLFELYNEYVRLRGARFAGLFYWWLVIKNLRSYAFKNSTMDRREVHPFVMLLGHNLKVSWRDLKKNRTTSLINVLGLSIGLAGFILIYRIVTFELSFDKHLPDRDRIYRVYSDFESTAGDSFTNYGISRPIPGYARDELKGVELLSHFYTFEADVKVDPEGRANDFPEVNTILLADSSYFQVIDQYRWLSGSLDQSLKEPFQVVLTEKQARAYFPGLAIDQIIGKTIVYQDSLKTYVSGVVQRARHNTDFDFTEMISFSTIDASWLEKDYGYKNRWHSTSSDTQLWLKLLRNTDKAALDKQLAVISDTLQQRSNDDVWRRDFLSQPLDELHFNTKVGTFDHHQGVTHLSTLKTLAFVAVALLLIAIFNFINLETAQANTKLKEVGIRKVIGSSRSLLLSRFLFNALITTVASILVAFPLAYWCIHLLHEFMPKELSLGLHQFDFWCFLLGTSLVVGLIAGLYPALLISAPKVSSALKQGYNGSGRNKNLYLRKGLILFQFVFSQFLIMSTIVVVVQIQFMLEKDLGFDQEGVIYVQVPWHAPDEDLHVLKNQVTLLPEVTRASVHREIPAYRGWSTRTFSHFKDSLERNFRAHVRNGDTDYLHVYGIDLLAGKMIAPREDGNEILINERLREEMGFMSNEEVLGQRLGQGYMITGVMSDFHTQSLHHDIESTVYYYSQGGRYLGIQIHLEQDLSNTVGKVAALAEEVYPNHTVEIHFLDQTIARLYETEKKTSKLASLATGVAIFISCLGLFGLISFTTLQRTKEIGIRKVLGATMAQIGNVISREFVILIAIALVVSVPLSFYYTQQWLEGFSYSIGTTWWIYVLGGAISLMVAFVSVAFKIWSASTANPVESLRYE